MRTPGCHWCRIAVGAGCALLLSACTLERRDEVPPTVAEILESISESVSEPVDQATMVHQTLAVFRESVQEGDVSQALRLLDRQALLLDDLVDRDSGRAPGFGDSRGLQLLALRRVHEAGLVISLMDAELFWLDEAAIVTSLLRVGSRDEEDAEAQPPSIEPGWVRESAVLRQTPDGWRILHLHRSRLP
jgi:ketosteroid isomerase-like protein